MAVALGAYATDPSLAGGNYARSFGFNMRTGGSGSEIYNVGSDGSGLWLSSNTSYAVLDLLTAADQLAAKGTSPFNGASSSLKGIFGGINQTGGI